MDRIACIGECMIELSQLDLATGQARIGFAGDTANTATYLARLGQPTAYLTNVGTDAFSDTMLARMQAEGIDTSLIGRLPDRLPGLYAIETDARGERSFRYWRNEAAARTLFSGTGPTLADLDGFATVYVSGITLAILPDGVRRRLIAALGALRARGVRTVFDPNYRPRLWRNAMRRANGSPPFGASLRWACPRAMTRRNSGPARRSRLSPTACTRWAWPRWWSRTARPGPMYPRPQAVAA